ncbi:MAG TPA: hypothetical protein VG710_12965 [Opitutus sp.]|nr:hypothetical protein [Opitutus sp.]
MPSIIHPPVYPGARFAAGAISGCIGGIAMALFAMIRSSHAGLGFWLPMQQIAATFYGVEALLGGPVSTFIGSVAHLIVASLIGALSASILVRARGAAAIWLGLSVGVIAWFVMTFLVLPWADQAMRERITLIAGWWFADHLVFGAMLFLTPFLDRAIESPATPHPARPGHA